MIKNISKYFNVFKRPKSLKMKAKDAYSAVKNKTVMVKEKFKKLSPIEKTVAIGVAAGIPIKAGALYLGAREGTRLAKQKKNGKR